VRLLTDCLVVERTGAPLASRVFVADTWGSRLRGLIGRRPLAPGEAIWILPCRQVHTHFLGYPLQLVFVDDDRRVARVIDTLRPWRISPWVDGAASVIELHAGHPAPVRTGDRLLRVPGDSRPR
jgi:uncharacterized membrane protein (UPF0127 family)